MTGPNARVEEWFSTLQDSVGYEVSDLNITTGETVAFCHSLIRISGTICDGEETGIGVRENPCFRKIAAVTPALSPTTATTHSPDIMINLSPSVKVARLKTPQVRASAPL